MTSRQKEKLLTESDYLVRLDSLLKDPEFKQRYDAVESLLGREMPFAREKLGEKYWGMFCAGVVILCEKHDGLSPDNIIEWARKNQDAMAKISSAITKSACTEEFHRVCPPSKKGNDEIVYFSVMSAFIAGNIYEIDPRLLVTVSGFENCFCNNQHPKGAIGIMQITGNSALSEFKDKDWVKRFNLWIGTESFALSDPKKFELRQIDMFNPLLNIDIGAGTLELKVLQGNRGGRKTLNKEDLLNPFKPENKNDVKLILNAYNNSFEGKNSYGDHIYDFMTKFYGLREGEHYWLVADSGLKNLIAKRI